MFHREVQRRCCYTKVIKYNEPFHFLYSLDFVCRTQEKNIIITEKSVLLSVSLCFLEREAFRARSQYILLYWMFL